MAVLDGKGHDDDLRDIGRTDADQVESGIIVRFADDEIPGIGALGAHMEIVSFHRWSLTPHSPATTAMTLDDTSDRKNRNNREEFQQIPHFFQVSPNRRTPNRCPCLSKCGPGARNADIAPWRTDGSL